MKKENTETTSPTINFLPPKKRFGKFQEYNNYNESTKTKLEKKMIPGVIRHTSSPDHSIPWFKKSYN